MKKGYILSCLMAFLAVTVLSAQDLDKILDKHYKAMGIKNLAKVKTTQASGYAVTMGGEIPITISNKRPDKMHILVEVQGSEIVQAYDGETAWAINPFMGISTPTEMSSEEAESVIEGSDMDGILWKYKKKGHQVELKGTEEVDGKEAYVLKITKKNGKIDHYYLDKESFLIVKVVATTFMNGAETEIEVVQSDYKEVEGYMMAFTIEQKAGGQTFMTMEFDKVEFNVELDDSMFSMPE